MPVSSFVELVRYIFTIPGVDSFLSEKLCQDPLENFFGLQRQQGRVHGNPNIYEFLNNTEHIRVIGSICRDTVKGNCQGANKKRKLDIEKESKPLPRRKYSRKK